MLLKCCTQYVSKLGKLSSGTGLEKVHFHFNCKVDKTKECSNYHTMPSFLMLERLGSKYFKAGFSSKRIENFQMYKLDLEKAEESEIRLPTIVGS